MTNWEVNERFWFSGGTKGSCNKVCGALGELGEQSQLNLTKGRTMGLDMYLVGVISGDENNKEEVIEIGYWRKHPNLHGYIVNTFAGGKDDCNPIYLTVEDLHTILDAIENDSLPFTSGFFFGRSPNPKSNNPEEIEMYKEQKEFDKLKFTEALDWLFCKGDEKTRTRRVLYEASW
jgi:hypothetical protein